MGDVDTSIYSRIAPPNNPLQMLPAAEAVNRLALFQQEFNAKKAIGEAYQQAIDPATGRIDTNRLMTEIKNRPDAGFMAGEASAGALSREGQMISNATGSFKLASDQNQFIRDAWGAIANKPNLTKRDMVDTLTTIARNTNIPTSVITGYLNGLPNDPKALREFAQTQQALAIGSAGTSARVTGPPVSTGPNAGAQTTVPLGAAIYGDQAAPPPAAGGGAPAAPAMSGAVSTTMPAGYGEAAATVGAASGQASNALRAAADTSMTRKGMLGNLEEDLQHFTAGPGADWQKVTKAWVNRNVPLPAGWQFDPKSIASQEAFNKQATMLAQQQFATIGGTGTDAKFSSAFETNPNDTLSQLGNQNIIRLLKGNEDAIQAKQKAWLNWRKQFGPQSYDEFSQDFNTRFDPRAFQFKYLSPRERQDYIDRMDSRDRDQFLSNLAAAHKAGWVTFPTR